MVKGSGNIGECSRSALRDIYTAITRAVVSIKKEEKNEKSCREKRVDGKRVGNYSPVKGQIISRRSGDRGVKIVMCREDD